MSKVGRKPIDISGLQVDIKGQEVHFKGKNAEGVHVLPIELSAVVDGDNLYIKLADSLKSDRVRRRANRLWGLNRALLANQLHGAKELFEKKVEINGLGYRASVSGKNVQFSLGYSHKIDLELPESVSLEVDKTGQKLTFKSSNKEDLGYICSKVRSLRPPEPYKGTGIKFADEEIIRKAGKTKAS